LRIIDIGKSRSIIEKAMKKRKTLFDIIGPAIIGPSSSHTAGAVRIGYIAGKIFKYTPQKVKFRLYNSFAKTGKGHGTDKGLLGGILGLDVDDEKIKSAFDLAKKMKVTSDFEFTEDTNKHPNYVEITLEKEGIPEMKISGASLGAAEIVVTEINGYKFNINGDFETLILIYKDKPGIVYRVADILQNKNLNIASMHCDRCAKGIEASMGICVDGEIPQGVIDKLSQMQDMYLIRKIGMLKK